MENLFKSIKELAQSNKEFLEGCRTQKPTKILIIYKKNETNGLFKFSCVSQNEIINYEFSDFSFIFEEILNIFDEEFNYEIKTVEDLLALNDCLFNSSQKYEVFKGSSFSIKELTKFKSNLIQIQNWIKNNSILAIDQKLNLLNQLFNELNSNKNITFSCEEESKEPSEKKADSTRIANIPKQDSFDISTSNPNLIFNNQIALRNDSNGGSAAGYVGRGSLLCSPGEKMSWEIKVIKLDQIASWDLGIGVCAISHQGHCFRGTNKSHCFCIWRNGELWNSENMYKKNTKGFTIGDLVKIELDMRLKILNFYINDELMGGWEGNSILDEEYRLFIEMRQPSSVEIMSCFKE